MSDTANHSLSLKPISSDLQHFVENDDDSMVIIIVIKIVDDTTSTGTSTALRLVGGDVRDSCRIGTVSHAPSVFGVYGFNTIQSEVYICCFDGDGKLQYIRS